MMLKVAREERDFLPSLHDGEKLIIVSDYGGEHSSSRYQGYSFLFSDFSTYHCWENKRLFLREAFLKDGRRIGYKKLNDKKTLRILPYFLDAADYLSGFSITILVSKEIKSLFSDSGYVDRTQADLLPYKSMKNMIFEKLFRIIHFTAFFAAGLSREQQEILWISDEDEIVPNVQGMYLANSLFATVLNMYLSHNLKSVQIGTTKSDVNRQMEDLASIPDLVVGCLSEMMSSFARQGLSVNKPFWHFTPRMKYKDNIILNWLSRANSSLKKMAFVVEPVKNSTSLTIKRMRLQGLTYA